MKKLKNIMSTDVEVVHPHDSISDVAERMRNLDVGAMPVCDGEYLHGMVTDRDIVIRGLAGHDDVSDITVEDVMTDRVIYCYEDEDISEAAKLMQKHQLQRLIVLDHDKRMVGIVSIADLAESGKDRLVGDTVEHIKETPGLRYMAKHGFEGFSSGDSSRMAGRYLGFLTLVGGSIFALSWFGRDTRAVSSVRDRIRRRVTESRRDQYRIAS